MKLNDWLNSLDYGQEFWKDKVGSATILCRMKTEIDNNLEKIDFSDAHPIIAEGSRYSISNGGKRLRSIVTLLLSECTGAKKKGIMKVAIAIELLHTASLILDDIMDNSETRRGKKSVQSKYGKLNAIMISHYLIFKSIELLMDCDIDTELKKQCISLICNSSKNMVEGQWWDLINADQDFMNYVGQIYKRSGQLFEFGSEMCAILGCLDKKVTRKMKLFGGLIGVLFQLRDDTLDFDDRCNLGKPRFQDFNQGRLTAPVIIVTSDKPDYRNQFMTLLKKSNKDDIDRHKFMKLIEITNATGECQKIILKIARDCSNMIKEMNDCEEKKVISDLIDYLCYRVV